MVLIALLKKITGISKKHRRSLLCSLNCLCVFLLILMSFVTAAAEPEPMYAMDGAEKKIYMTENMTLDLSQSYGSSFKWSLGSSGTSSDSNSVSLDENGKLTAKRFGRSVVYGFLNPDEMNFKRPDISLIVYVSDSKLNILHVSKDDMSKTFDFSGSEFARFDSVNIEQAENMFSENEVLEYDMILFEGTGFACLNDSSEWSGSFASCMRIADSVGSVLIQTPGNPNGPDPFDREYLDGAPYIPEELYDIRIFKNMTQSESDFCETFFSKWIRAGDEHSKKANADELMIEFAGKLLEKTIEKSEPCFSTEEEYSDALSVYKNKNSQPYDFISAAHRLKALHVNKAAQTQKLLLFSDDPGRIQNTSDSYSLSLPKGGFAVLKLSSVPFINNICSPIRASDVIWTSDNEDVISVENGVVYAKDVGVANISAEYAGLKVTASVDVTQKIKVLLFYSINKIPEFDEFSDAFDVTKVCDATYTTEERQSSSVQLSDIIAAGQLDEFDIIIDKIDGFWVYNPVSNTVLKSAVQRASEKDVFTAVRRAQFVYGGDWKQKYPIADTTYEKEFNKIKDSDASVSEKVSQMELLLADGALRKKIKFYKTLKAEDYTDETWQPLQAELSRAESILWKKPIDGDSLLDPKPSSETIKSYTDAIVSLKYVYKNLKLKNSADTSRTLHEIYTDLYSSGFINVRSLESSETIYIGDVYKLESYKKSENSSIDKLFMNYTWTVVDQNEENPCISLTKSGLVTALRAGSARIEVNDGSGYTKKFNITVFPKIKRITFDVKSVTLIKNETYTVALNIFPISASGEKLIWKCDNSSVASVSEDGVITAVGYGVATVTAEAQGIVSLPLKIYVKAPESERIRILMLGYENSEQLENAANTFQFSPYIEYRFIPSYTQSFNVSPELKKMAENSYGNFDIIVFDLEGGHIPVNESLTAAKASGKKVVILDGSEVSYASNKEADKTRFDRMNATFQKIRPAEEKESYLWSQKFLYELVDLFVPDKTKSIPDWNYKKINVLYIGPDSESMKECVDTFESKVYGNFSEWTFKQMSSIYNETEGSSYKNNLKEFKNFDPKEYDVILCDKFYHEGEESVKGTFADIFGFDGTPEYWSKWPQTTFVITRLNDSSNLSESSNFKIYNEELAEIDLSPENVQKTFKLYYSILHEYGNGLVRNWPFTKYTEDGFIIHPIAERTFKTTPEYIEWYEASHYYTKDAPYIGIFGFSVYNLEIRELTRQLEAAGYNVIVGVGDSTGVFDDMSGYFIDPNTQKCYVTCFVSFKNWALNYWNQKEGVRELKHLNVPIVKAVGNIRSNTGKTNETWGNVTMYDKNSGIPESVFSWMASSSNVDGMLDFIALTEENIPWIADRAIAWAELNRTKNEDKDIAFMYYNYPPGKEEIGANYLNVMRSLAGDGAMERVAAGNKSIPIHDPVFKGLIRRLQEEGYSIDMNKLPVATMIQGGTHVYDYSQNNTSLTLNEENLIHLIYAQGINVGSYAPGVLDTMVAEYINYHENIPEGHNPDGSDWWGCELIPVTDYISWMNDEVSVRKRLDPALQKELYDTWGNEDMLVNQAPGKDNNYLGGMIWYDKDGRVGPSKTNYLVIPMVKFGDVRLMPQPNRALASDTSLDSATYHGDISPTHQYVAFYFWLTRGTGNSLFDENETSSKPTGIYDFHNKTASDLGIDKKPWKPDAVIHFGTHGTHEWLPGTSVGLRRNHEWGPVLLPSLPNIYPYIVANVGEGLTAEYRGNALIISHLTPPMIKTQLYDDLVNMEAAILGYQKQKASAGGDPAIVKAYREIVSEEIFALGWQDAFKDVFDSFLTKDKAGVATNDTMRKELICKYLTENDSIFDDFLEDYLHTHVKAIKENSLSYGMHTYSTFDTTHIAPMVWNMWSRQGLDDILLETYFSGEGLTTIPTKNKVYINGSNVSVGTDLDPVESKYDESDVLAFVEKVVAFKDENGSYADPGADDIRGFLDETFKEDVANKEFQDKVILFLLGPAGLFSDSTYSDSKEIVDGWKRMGIYKDFREHLFEFYWYQTVPKELQGTPADSYRELKAVDGTILGDTELTEVMNRFVSQVVTNESYKNNPSETVEKSLALSGLGMNNTTRPWYNEEIVFYILGNNRIQYDERLRECGASEEQAVLKALSGGFVEPSGGNDPVQRPSVLPTGRNFYGVDPSMYSTPAAWKVGQAMGKQMILNYYERNGKWPDTMSFMRFGVDYMRDEGTLEACLFWLLGCEPTWTTTGVFKGAVPVHSSDSEKYDDMFKIKLRNGTEVYRPRVDIVYNSAGMRDGYGSMLRHIDRAVKAVANLDDEENVSNNVKKNAREIQDMLIKAGVSESLAKELSTSRVYAQALGTYEIGTGNLVSASGKMGDKGENQDDIRAVADLYLKKMGYLYTEKNWGETSDAIAQAMRAMLGRTDASVFSSSSNLFDSLDNDDVFQYFGIMNLASSMYDQNGSYIENKSEWKSPDMYIADTSNIDNYKQGDKVVYTAGEFIQKDLSARYFNPKWIEGQMKAGYSGATMYKEIIDNLYGWSVASNGALVSDATWNRVFETYMDQGIVDWMGETSPYALQSIAGRMIEVNRTGYWNVSEEQMKHLLETYVESVVETGIACCHHTCGNPTFDKFVSGMMSTPLSENLSPEMREKYWEIVKNSTGREDPSHVPPDPTSKPKSGSNFGSKAVQIEKETLTPSPTENNVSLKPVNNTNESGEGVGKSGGEIGSSFVSGIQMIEKTLFNTTTSIMEFLKNPTFSSSNIFVILFIVLIVGVMYYGFKRRSI